MKLINLSTTHMFDCAIFVIEKSKQTDVSTRKGKRDVKEQLYAHFAHCAKIPTIELVFHGAL